MRLLATLLVLLAAIYLHLRGVQRDTKDDRNIFFYNNGESPNVTAYVELLEALRSRLASGTHVHGIAVTRPLKNVTLQERFVQVELKIKVNDNKTGAITVIINTVDVYVVGYFKRSGTLLPTLRYFNDTPTELFQAFHKFPRKTLGFNGSYKSLGNRAENELGHHALNIALENLYYDKSDKGGALLVIIQMVSEAVRIRYIEHLIRRNMLSQTNFKPDPRAIIMENSWSKLSKQIQLSGERGVFLKTIELVNVLNESVSIVNEVVLKRVAALDLMLFHCNREAIRMPVPGVVGADEQRPYGEPTTNIMGRNWRCVDVKDNKYDNGNAIILEECRNAQRNQLWTFKSDGTIRSNGKCLKTDGEPTTNITIFDCDRVVREHTQWILYNAGTIMNPKSGLVIAAETSTQGTLLTVAKDNNSSRQAWSAGNYTDQLPTRYYISGFREMCLQASRENNSVWLVNCAIGTEPSRQHWALYGDSTIRLYINRTFCVTSHSRYILDSIILSKCKGSENQRWTFMADGTILNPNARLVMDVPFSNVSLQEIILNKPTGNPNQKWLAF